jgi:hypothetical protein
MHWAILLCRAEHRRIAVLSRDARAREEWPQTSGPRLRIWTGAPSAGEFLVSFQRCLLPHHLS